ncbi:hypothetical protein LWC34_46380 [Kibdelosporangium philippinense]|uniref:Uncharacterized protein n=1 Tax=Kibdelosporangium philippinense TaxID=211113 RepID=A0ABS8ZSG7_9PSEU|nr:hypothetical protein [Kibdelosporangium philippinense]MCE7010183.1 hypothetical protein [Kibdelosporangium philippinense]
MTHNPSRRAVLMALVAAGATLPYATANASTCKPAPIALQMWSLHEQAEKDL